MATQLITNLAADMGLSTSQMAGLLGLSSSQLYMALRGQRHLPAAALQRLLAWQQQWQAAAPAPAFALETNEIPTLRQLLHRRLYEAMAARRHYEKLEQRHLQLRRFWQFAQGWLATPEALPERERRWLALQAAVCKKRLRRCSALAVAKARLRADALAQEVVSLQALLTAAEGPA